MKTILVSFLLLVMATVTYASKENCPMALLPYESGFCPSFQTSATCNCKLSAPNFFCKNMKDIYSNMMFYYGSLEKACRSQKITPAQVCIDSWNCYRHGGKDSEGNSCQSTGSACELVKR